MRFFRIAITCISIAVSSLQCSSVIVTNNVLVAEAAHKPLPQPKDLSKQTSGNMAVIMWNLGDNVDVSGYSYKVVVNGTQNSIVKSASVQLTKLKANKQYIVKVYTMKGNRKSKPGIIKFKTPKELTNTEIKEKQVPSSVRKLKVEDVVENRIALSWLIPAHHVKSLSGFKITVNGNEYDTIKATNDSKEFTYELTNLEFSRTYTISVAATNYAGIGTTSTVKARVKKEGASLIDMQPVDEIEEPDNKEVVKDSKTRDSSKRIGQVQNLRLGNSETEIVIVWDEPIQHPEKIKDYKVYVNGDLVETTTSMKYTYYAPKLNKPYKMEVRAEDDKGVEGMAKSMWCNITKERGVVAKPSYKKVIKVKKLPQTGEDYRYTSIGIGITGIGGILILTGLAGYGFTSIKQRKNKVKANKKKDIDI